MHCAEIKPQRLLAGHAHADGQRPPGCGVDRQRQVRPRSAPSGQRLRPASWEAPREDAATPSSASGRRVLMKHVRPPRSSALVIAAIALLSSLGAPSSATARAERAKLAGKKPPASICTGCRCGSRGITTSLRITARARRALGLRFCEHEQGILAGPSGHDLQALEHDRVIRQEDAGTPLDDSPPRLRRQSTFPVQDLHVRRQLRAPGGQDRVRRDPPEQEPPVGRDHRFSRHHGSQQLRLLVRPQQ